MSQKLERLQKYLNMYHKMVLKNIANIVGYDFAEDVAQETFWKLYEHLDYLKENDVKPWILVVSANIAKDYCRKKGKYEEVSLEYKMSEINETAEECLLTESIEELFLRKENQKAARELMRTACDLLYEKNPDWYYIMIDSCILEMSSKQIAAVLNMSVSKINVERMRARKFLHKKLGKQYEEFFN